MRFHTASSRAGYLNIRNSNTSFFGANPNAGPATTNNLGSFGSTTSPESNPVFAGYASANRMEIAGVATGVMLGALNVNLAYSNTRFENLGSSSGPDTLRYQGTAYDYTRGGAPAVGMARPTT
jgi:hypothetical protein